MDTAGALIVEISMGVGLAACAGLRAFLPLFATGLAARLGILHLWQSFEWMASGPALVVFGVAVFTEILSDKIPFVDHVLDLLETFIKPAAGALIFASVAAELTPLQRVVVGIVAGGFTAGLVHLAKAKVRLASSVLTAGLANPILSLAEDVAALLGWVAAVLFPILMLILVAAGLASVFLTFWVWRLRVRQWV